MDMKKVKFTQMKDGTKEDYLLLEKHEKKFIEETPSRILKYMSSLTSTLEGYQVSRLEHSLQAATIISSSTLSFKALVADCRECSNLDTL